jgi:transposase
MAMGKRRRHAKQASMWVATQDLPRSAAHPFYARLNQIFEQHGFDGYVEGLCERFYAGDGRPGVSPGRYFRLLLIGYFEGLDAERLSGAHSLPLGAHEGSRAPRTTRFTA